jgi:hypothetical protein
MLDTVQIYPAESYREPSFMGECTEESVPHRDDLAQQGSFQHCWFSSDFEYELRLYVSVFVF